MLDFAAWACTFAGNIVIGQLHHRTGWLILLVGLLLWAYVGLRARLGKRPVWGLVAGSLASSCVALWNWWTW